MFIYHYVMSFRTRETSGLSLDDNREIRNALFGLVHFYVDRDTSYDELNCLLNFILAIEDEFVVRRNVRKSFRLRHQL